MSLEEVVQMVSAEIERPRPVVHEGREQQAEYAAQHIAPKAILQCVRLYESLLKKIFSLHIARLCGHADPAVHATLILLSGQRLLDLERKKQPVPDLSFCTNLNGATAQLSDSATGVYGQSANNKTASLRYVAQVHQQFMFLLKELNTIAR